MTRAGVLAFLRERIVYAPITAIVLWVCYAGSIVLGGRPFGESTLSGQLVFPDHLAFYTAARLIHNHTGDKIYDNDFVMQYQATLFADGKWDSLEAFRNPPFYALLYYPTASGSFVTSAWFWTAVSFSLLAISVHWLTRDVRDRMPRRVLLWCLTFYPVFAVISYGQNSLLSTFAFAGTYVCLQKGHRFLAGMVAGLLCFKPPLLLGLIVWGLIDIRRLWPCALGVMATGAILCGVSYPLIPEVWQGFIQSLQNNVAFDNFEQFKMHNPVAFWRLLMPNLPDRIRWLFAMGCSLAAVLVFFQLWLRRRDSLPVMFGACVFLTLWASPHALIYEWAILIIPALLWWSQRDESKKDEWFILYFVSWITLFISTHVSEGQLLLQKWLFGAVLYRQELESRPDSWLAVAFQFSVPVMAWVGWRASQLLRESPSAVEADPARLQSTGTSVSPTASDSAQKSDTSESRP